jgi:hypothetical protein
VRRERQGFVRPRRAVGVLCGLVALLVGARGSARSAASPGPTTPSIPAYPGLPPLTSTTDPYHAAALAEANALLAKALAPPGSKVHKGAASDALSGPIMGSLASDHFVDVDKWWVVPESMSSTLSCLTPTRAGLTPSGRAGDNSFGSGATGWVRLVRAGRCRLYPGLTRDQETTSPTRSTIDRTVRPEREVPD